MRNIEKWRSVLIVDLEKSIGDDDFMTRCPCHSDDKASLRVRIGENGDIVMHCFVCAAKGTDVCENLGFPTDWLEADEEAEEESGRELEAVLKDAADLIVARAEKAAKGIERGEHVIADVIAETTFTALKRMVADHYSKIYCRGRLGADGKLVSDQVAMAVAKEVNERDF